MTKIYFILFFISLNAFSQTGEFAKKSWCTGLSDNEVYPHIKAAADFAGLDPLLLAIGMSSEGFAVKTDRPENCRLWPVFNDDKTITQQQCVENDALETVTQEPTHDYVEDSKGEWVAGPPKWDTYTVMVHSYYGDTWPDDGADTFCMEMGRLRREGLFPMNFSHDNLARVPTYSSLEQAPDVVCDDTGFTNEPASMRFHQDSMSLPFEKRWRVPSDKTVGDEGHAWFKNGETQAFANAAMWKDANNKFDKAFTELAGIYPNLKEKEVTPEERIFWTKIFYNGGQGTQAGAYAMLKNYAKNDYLKDESYLTRNPSKYYQVLYVNGRYTLDSYQYAKSINCPNEWIESSKSYERYSNAVLPSRNNEENKSSEQR